ncbi:MAG: arginase [Bdellovibrionales bacterium]|nr:arginase [Bdellovibrionales bacterium]
MQLTKTDIILVHHDLGASVQGASKGPQLLYDHIKNDLFAENFLHNIHQTASFKNPTNFKHAKRIDHIAKTMFELSETVKATLQRSGHCFVLSGDHSTAAGTVAGIKKAYPEKRIGVVWFDAHADIHSPHTTPSGNLHGMPLAIITDQDNTLHRTNEISEAEHTAWEELQSLSVITPAALPRDVAFVGIRDLESPEQKLVNLQGSLNLFANEMETLSAQSLYEKITHHLKDCDFIYISFDIDCLDSDLVPGTGTPVNNGPNFEKIKKLLQLLRQNPKVICIEVSEYNPDLDRDNQALHTTLDVIKSIF